MKKLIYSLSIAMAFGIAANAATPSASLKSEKANLKEAQMVTTMPAPLTLERISENGKKVKRNAATKAEDFVGNFKWSGRNQLSQEVFPNEGIMTITQDANNPNKLIISGFDIMADPGLSANFDPATGRLYVPNQFTFLNTYYNKDVWFVNWTVYNGETDEGEAAYGLMPAEASNQFYFTLTDEGNIRAGSVDPERWDNHTYTDEELADVCCIACNMMPDDDSGFFWMCFGVTGSSLKEFEFIEDEWTKLGNATFKDAWFPLVWEGGNTPEYEVPLYFEKNNPGTYMLYDPYGYGGQDNPYVFYDINIAPDKPGYLIFNITDPECIVFEPSIYTMTLDLSDPGDDALPTEIYCYNYEGLQYYAQGASKTDIIIYMEQNGGETSWFDQRSKTIMINNAIFSMGLNPSDYYTWQNYDMSGYVVLTDNYQDSVESLFIDDNNAPVEYYNLQGVRVANPEKGQILIVRKGNKATKQIIR